MPIPAFLKMPFLDLAHTVWSMPEEYWIDDSPRISDTDLVKKEAEGDSSIDERKLRSEMVEQWSSGSNGVSLRIKVLPGRTRLLFVGTDDQWSQIPWATWARIFQAIGYPIDHVLFYANPLKREFPTDDERQKGIQIHAKNINAGYSYLCQTKIVVIFRFEEATRVLLHELLHTACFDSELGVEDLEANTEAWTEILLCAILSKGKPRTFTGLWAKQCRWIEAQTDHLQTVWKLTGPHDYAWRYTIGRHEVLVDRGFMYKGKDSGSIESPSIPIGLRFTTPEWDAYL